MISHRHASNSSEIGQNPANVTLDDVALADPNSNTLVSSAALGADVAAGDDVAGRGGTGGASWAADFGTTTVAEFFFLPNKPIRDAVRDAGRDVGS